MKTNLPGIPLPLLMRIPENTLSLSMVNDPVPEAESVILSPGFKYNESEIKSGNVEPALSSSCMILLPVLRPFINIAKSNVAASVLVMRSTTEIW